jgi:DNA-binding response OmpR family regulator
MRLLIAEDEKDLNAVITKQLVREKYIVDSCFDGEEALDWIASNEYDALILDIMMPKVDGYEVLRRVREAGKYTPVLFLTARDSIEDRVKGLDRGADDYIVKPFAFDELAARIRVMTRRQNQSGAIILTDGGLALNTSMRTIEKDGKRIDLSVKEYALLEYLMINAGVILSRSRIEDHVWGYATDGGTNVVDVYISYLRKKLAGAGAENVIKTVRGFGFTIDPAEPADGTL